MGYISTVEGEITAVRENDTENIFKEAIDDLEDYKETHRHNGGYWIENISSSIVNNRSEILIEYYGDGKAYYIEKEVKEVVEILKEYNFTANGNIYVEGEESGDFSKVSVKDNIVRFCKAVVTVEYEDGEKIITSH